MSKFEQLLKQLGNQNALYAMATYHNNVEEARLADEAIKAIESRLVAMHTAKTDNAWHLWPRRGQTRNGKAVGDVPGDGSRIAFLHKGAWRLGTFVLESSWWRNKPSYALAREDGGAMWQDVQFWYALPTITTDDSGDMVLPFEVAS